MHRLSAGGDPVKVVIFCGGQGLRMRAASAASPRPIPKPMIPIGGRPILWHVMRYYAHFGFTDFVLCLGYHAEAIRSYFLGAEAIAGPPTDDVTAANGSCAGNGNGNGSAHQLTVGFHGWRVTLADTGLDASVGQRLRSVRHLLRDEETFLANYGDTLTDADLPAMISRARLAEAPASLLAVRPNQSFHVVSMNGGGRVRGLLDAASSGLWINGGYFVLRNELLDELGPDEDLVDVFHRLAADDRLLAQRHEGFWAPMDTFKDRQLLDGLHDSGRAPWQVWNADRHDALSVAAG